MYVLEPIFHYTIWGGSRLVDVYGAKANGLGHLYSLRCTDKDSNTILNGKFAGQRLYNVIGMYPLSIALVDAASDLSIQVHPGGNLAKYESYYFISAPDSGYIYSGFTEPEKDICSILKADSILSYIEKTYIQNGEYIHIEPRTVHALTAGSFVYEIEQGEDNTYRLFDYYRPGANSRPRELQVEQANNALDASLKAKTCIYQQATPIIEKTYMTRLLTDLIYYKNTSPNYECLTLLSGHAIIDSVLMRIGMTVILEPEEALEKLEVEKCIIARSLI